MIMRSALGFVLLGLGRLTEAHMSLWFPGPLGGAMESNNASTTITVDSELNFPFGCCDSGGQPTLPSPGQCRGHLDLFDAQDAPVVWRPGADAYFQLSDHTYSPDAPGGTHYGGSCQVGFSIDLGRTWRVAASYNGNCPHRGEDGSPDAQTFHFRVPIGMPEGKTLFAWIWLNREHEFFMNCAIVKIEGDSSKTTSLKHATPTALEPEHAAATEGLGENPTPPPREHRRPLSPSVAASSMSLQASSAMIGHGSSANWYHQGQDEKDNNPKDTDGTDGTSSHNQHRWDRYGSSVEGRRTVGHHLETMAPEEAGCEHDGSIWPSCASKDRRTSRTASFSKTSRKSIGNRDSPCSWATAPRMEVSYFTIDATCAANAKMNMAESDSFEIGWDEPCGVVEGDGEYPIQLIDCNMFQ